MVNSLPPLRSLPLGLTTATVRTPATSANLGPGFDCLGLALDLHDRVALEIAPRAGTGIDPEPIVHVRGEGHDRLPRNERNLALRAVLRVLREVAPSYAVVRLTMENAIPIGGGLGSSAAAIVGGAVAANHALGSPLSIDALLHLALELEPHADNLSPALYGGFTVAVVEPSGHPVVVALPPPTGLRAVVLTPDLAISTHRSRATLPRHVPHADAAFNVGRAALLVAGLLSGRYDVLRAGMDDRLHQLQRTTAYPAMPLIIDAALDAGAVGAALSGSGPSILALCTGLTGPVVAAMHAAATAAGLTARTHDLAIVARGATIVS